MSRYRLEPTPGQVEILSGHCGHARYVWNLCVEQESGYRPGRGRMPGFAERCRQLTEARADNPWLADRAGRWHVAFASVPEPVPAPGNGEVAGVDRGVFPIGE